MRCSFSFSRLQSGCLKIVNASPIALLCLLFGWSYLAYNFSLVIDLFNQDHAFQGFFYTVIYHPIFILCIWSYYEVCSTSPGFTTELNDAIRIDRVVERDLEQEEDTIGLLSTATQPAHGHDTSTSGMELLRMLPKPITVKRDGKKRFCQKCQLEKYDRTHHCRQCKRCVLKMDHHCPWVNNCVGFHNYKAFFLFLNYASLYCTFVFATTLPATIHQVNTDPLSILGIRIQWALLVFFSGIFGLFLIPFTLFHTRQLCKNRTTIEYYEKSNYRFGRHGIDIMRTKYFNPWDMGTRKNIEQVLGKGPLWKKLIPVGRSLGDGTTFPINKYAYETLGGLTDEEEDENEELENDVEVEDQAPERSTSSSRYHNVGHKNSRKINK